jgi:putative transposase
MTWANFVREGAPHWEDRQITEALIRSKPWVSDDYAKKLFKDNPGEVLIRHRGRPKKLTSMNSVA